LTEFINKGNRKLILLIILAFLAFVSLIQGIRNGVRDSQDFQWDAAKVLSQGINPYDESLNPSGILDEYDYEDYYLQMEANQFPSLLMILFPFTVLKPLTARYVWLVCNLILTALSVFLLRKTFLEDMDRADFAILICLMLAGTPYRNQLGVGQHTIFAFTFFLLAVYFEEYCSFFKEESDKKKILKFLLVTACIFICFFKYTLTVPLVLYFIYKNRYFEILAAGFLHLLLTFVAAKMLNDTFINMIVKPLKVSSALSAEGGIDFGVLLNGSKLSYLLLLLVMVLLFILSLRMEKGHEKAYMATLVLWSLIVTYHRTYDFFVVILAVAFFYDLPEFIKNNKKIFELFEVHFLVMFISIYFMLRVFSEAAFSKLIAGIIYYTLTVFVTAVVIKGYMFKGKSNE